MKHKRTVLLPLSRQFTLILILFAILASGITLYSAYDYTKLQTSFLNDSLKSYSSRLAKTAQEAYESYENICYSIAYSQTVQDYLESTVPADTYKSYKLLENQLSNTALLNPYIVDVAVYGQDGLFASLGGSASDYEAFALSLSDSRFPYRSVGVATINSTLCHILSMPVYSLHSGESRYLGILFLSVDVNSLLSNSLNEENSSYHPEIIFTDDRNGLVYGEPSLYEGILQETDKNGVFQITGGVSERTTYAVTGYFIPGIDHMLYVLIDKSQLTRQVAQISERLFLGIATLIAAVLLLLLLLYRPLITSLKQLTDFMKTISTGDRRPLRDGAVIDQGLIGSSEIANISAAFNDMLLETDELNHTIFDTYTRMYELEANNRKTEIAFLRSQINPHFLYNTLTMICGMAAEGMNEKIISVTGALSQIFRYSIKGSDMVPLREEMEIVRSYLMIQEERFEGRFCVRYDLSEDSSDCLIPKMVIQPLVENAIVHGLEKNLSGGELLIAAEDDPDHSCVIIRISDTGAGMPADKLEQLQNAIMQSVASKSGNAPLDLTDMDAPNHDSIGILNVNSRMFLYYGTDFTLAIDSVKGEGTTIRLRVPYQPEAYGTKKESIHVPGNCD